MSTFTESVTFSGQTDLNNATGMTAGPNGNELYLFDSNGGTLNSVTLSYSFNPSADITVTDTGNSAATGSAYTMSTPQFGANDAAVGDVLARNNGPVFGSATNFTLAPGGTTSFSSAGNEAYTYTDTNASDLAAFSQPGGGTFTPLLSTMTNPVISSAGGNVVATESPPQIQATYTISYNYTDQSTDQPPMVTASGGTASYLAGSAPVTVDSGVKVSDPDNTTLASATVAITNFQPGDLLSFTNNGKEGNISGSYAADTGVLTLMSAGDTATLAQFQAALDSVTYSNASATPNTTTRTITFSANDGQMNVTAPQTDQVAIEPAAPAVGVAPSTAPYGQPVTISVTGGADGDTIKIYEEAANAPAGTQPTLIYTISATGSTVYYTTPTLPDGADSITATDTWQGDGKTSPMSSRAMVTVFANAPTNLMQTGTAIDGGTISISGQAQDGPDDTVTITIQGASGATYPTGQATVTPGTNGAPNTFTYTSPEGVPDGRYTVTATDTSADGTQHASASITAVVLPSTPTVYQANEPVYQGPIELTGTGEAGDTLNVTIDGKAAAVVNTTGGGAGTVGANGTYDVTTTMAYMQGQYPVSVTETDSQGLTSQGASTIAAVAPPRNPTITGLANSTTNLQDPTQPFAGATVSDPTSNATDTVTIAPSGAAGTLSGTGLTANANGTYTLGAASPATLTKELDALAFTPSPANGGPVETTTFALTVTSSTTASSMASVTSTIDSTSNAPLFGSTTTSTSSVGGEVYALYQTILGRAPDPVGFENQVAAVDAGAPLTAVAQSLLDSSEYAADYGTTVSSNTGYVDQLYEDGLHRAADAGAQGYVNALNSGSQSRTQVAIDIATSPESSNDLAPTFQAGVFVPDATDSAVARLYYGLLDRAPDASGLQAQASEIHNGTSLGQVIQGFLGSAEYQTTTVGQDNLAYVEGFYQTALGRMGDAAGLQGYETALDTGTASRANVADDFLTGTEFQSDEAGQSNASYINAVYEAALGRAADPAGLANWEMQLTDGTTRQMVAEDIVGSSEFASHATAPGQAEFVTQLYEGALGRAPAASETQGWQNAFNGGASLATVAGAITQSPEAMANLAPKIEAGFHIA